MTTQIPLNQGALYSSTSESEDDEETIVEDDKDRMIGDMMMDDAAQPSNTALPVSSFRTWFEKD